MRRLGDHVALVVSLTALVVALGGTALAANYVVTSSSQIKDGAVASADIKNGSLTGTDIKDGSVASADIKNGSLTGTDIKDRSLSPSDFNGSVTGPTGPAGPAGPAGPKGETGAAGPSDTYAAFRESGTVTAGIGVMTTVTFFQVPAGSWLIQGNLVLTNTAAAAREVTCTLSGGAGTIDTATTVLDAAGGLDTQTVSLAGTVGPADPIFASLNCNTSLAGAQFADGDLIATQVGTLHKIASRP